MRRGTTPTLRLALEDIDPEEIRSLYTLKQGDKVLLVGNAGNSGYDRASLCLGVRPVFCIS